MTPEERDLTTILLDRLNKTEGQKDPEAEALIRQATTERHGAPYYLVQTVLIQDLSLHNARSRITDLETQVTETSPSSSAAPSFLGAPTFLGAVFGPSEPSRSVGPNTVPPSGLGTGPPPIATTQQPRDVRKPDAAAPLAPGVGFMVSGGFLRSAAMTAAGIGGGALVFEGIQSMFGHHDAATITGNQAALPSLGATLLNKGYGAETGASAAGSTDEHGPRCDPDLPDPTAGSGQDFTSGNSS
jgi:hypothetical protein